MRPPGVSVRGIEWKIILITLLDLFVLFVSEAVLELLGQERINIGH